ncbi:ComF family protein [Parapedobacter sp. DT-150]|uniref:ComF family protein n=1 Tax=Parapedobacter sp. DT-150 TaxID=3396162 RepID=UPI003F1D1CD6
MENISTFRAAIDVNGVIVPHHYLCHYRTLRFGFDALSCSIIHFKQGYPDAVSAWVDCAMSAARSVGMGKGDIVVRPMGSFETEISACGLEYSLDEVCRAMAYASNSRYLPVLLEKRHSVPSLNGMNRTERREAVRGAYRVSPEYTEMRFRRIWVIDDVLTTGATASEIARILLEAFPKVSLSIFTLAKAENNVSKERPTALHGARYRWSAGGRWTRIGMRL